MGRYGKRFNALGTTLNATDVLKVTPTLNRLIVLSVAKQSEED